MTLTFESADEILGCDHSNETSLPVLSHGAIFFFKISQNKIWKFGRNLLLAKFGSERVNLFTLKGQFVFLEISSICTWPILLVTNMPKRQVYIPQIVCLPKKKLIYMFHKKSSSNHIQQ